MRARESNLKTRNALRLVFHGIKDFAVQQVLPNLYSFYAERKIRRQIKAFNDANTSFTSPEPGDLQDFTKELEAYQMRQDERRKTIDEKAKSSLLAVTVATTLMLSGLTLIKERKISFGYLLLLLIVTAIAYFTASAITAVRALNLSPLNITHPQDWIDAENAEGPTAIKKPERTSLLYSIVSRNDFELNIRANFVSATLTAIRNGVFFLSLAFTIAILNLGNQVRYTASDVQLETHGISQEQSSAPLPGQPENQTTPDLIKSTNATPRPDDKPTTPRSAKPAPK